MITAEEIRAKLLEAFPHARVQVVDTTGTFDHFDAVVVEESFRTLSRVRHHQAVYEALGDAFRDRIHALALKTMAP